jgi:phage terminase large subunit-like protein
LCESELLHEDGLPMVKMRQGFGSMSAPTKHLESVVLRGELRHSGNPVLRYHASNAAVRVDPAGNIKVDKERSTERVDGMVALVMAVGRSMADYQKPSPYGDRGILTL